MDIEKFKAEIGMRNIPELEVILNIIHIAIKKKRGEIARADKKAFSSLEEIAPKESSGRIKETKHRFVGEKEGFEKYVCETCGVAVYHCNYCGYVLGIPDEVMYDKITAKSHHTSGKALLCIICKEKLG